MAIIEPYGLNRAVRFELDIVPPRATAQQKGVFVVNGKPRFFEKSKVKSAREILFAALQPHKLERPLTGAIKLKVSFVFPYRKSEKKAVVRLGEPIPHVVRPDLDNLEKLLLDVMTAQGFWLDDAQVFQKETRKLFGSIGKILVGIKEFEK